MYLRAVRSRGRAIVVACLLGNGATLASAQQWIQATAAAPWTARADHASLSYNGKMWIMGGRNYASNTLFNDVWYSTNGWDWTQATPNAGWAPRDIFCAVVHDGKMWVIGGRGLFFPTNVFNDVWWSTDGVNWTQATSASGWSQRYNLACESFNAKMWMLGGRDAGGYRNDVWSSSDGATWVQDSASAAFPTSAGHASVVFGSQMCIMGGWTGGGFTNDIHCSSNGVDWSLATGNPGWTDRSTFGLVVWSNAIWMMGGVNDQQPSPQRFNDVWISQDTVQWSQSSASPAPWARRADFDTVVFDDKVWVLGGYVGDTTGTDANDIWYLTSAPIPTLSEWGVMAMGLLTVAAGTVVVIRRRRVAA